VVSLEVTPDGSTIASLTGIGELRVFDVVRRSSRSLKVTFEEQGEAVVAVSPDARWVAAGGSGGVRIFGLASAARWSFPTPDRVKELAFSPDGRSLAYVSGGTFSIHVVDLRSGAVRVLPGEGFVGTSRGLLSVTFSPDSAMLVAGSDDATLRVWDLARGRVRVVPARTGFVSFVLFDGPHTVLACNSDTKCALYDAGSGKTLAEFSGHRNALVDVRLSADRTKLATLSADRTLRVWAMPTPDRRPLVVGEDKLSSVRVAPDSQGLVVTTDGRGALYYPSQGAPPREVATRQTGTGAFRPDGLELAVAEGARVRLVELATGRTRDLVGHTEPLYDVEYSPRGDRLASAGTDKTVRLWDLAAGTSRLFAGHERAVARVDFSPDGLVLASAGFDGAIRLWTVETGESVVLPTNANMVFGVRFSPDGARLVTSQDDGTILVWNVKQRVVERRLEGHSGAVYLAAVSVDGQLVASASADHTVRLADLATGASVELGHHLSEAQEVSFSPDGRRLVSCGWDGLVRFYPLEVPSGPAVRAWLDGRTRARLGADDVFGSAAQ
jgi:WD40 repeat protein